MIDQTTHSSGSSPAPVLDFWQNTMAELETPSFPCRVLVHGQQGQLSSAGIHSRVPAPRLLVCTNHMACYRLPGDPGGTDVVLAAGEALLLGANSPIANVSRHPYQSLGIIFYPDSLRLYGIRHAPHDQDITPDPLRLQHHNYVHPAPLSEDGHRLLACALNAGAFPADGPYRRHLVTGLLTQVRVSLAQQPNCEEGKAARTFRALVRHVEAHLTEPITRDLLAQALRLHPNHVSRLFGRFTNGTFMEFLRNSRLDLAEGHLHAGRLTVAETAFACGFGSSSALIRAFRRRNKVTPGRWASAGRPSPTRSIVQDRLVQ